MHQAVDPWGRRTTCSSVGTNAIVTWIVVQLWAFVNSICWWLTCTQWVLHICFVAGTMGPPHAGTKKPGPQTLHATTMPQFSSGGIRPIRLDTSYLVQIASSRYIPSQIWNSMSANPWLTSYFESLCPGHVSRSLGPMIVNTTLLTNFDFNAQWCLCTIASEL